MTHPRSQEAWNDLIDYDAYARSFPHDERLFAFTETESPPQGEFLEQSLDFTSELAEATTAGQEEVQEEVEEEVEEEEEEEEKEEEDARSVMPVDDQQLASLSTTQPTTRTQSSSPPPTRDHPRAATIPGMTPGRKGCDDDYNKKVNIHSYNLSLLRKLRAFRSGAIMQKTG